MCDLDAENKKLELDTIKQIVHNNGYEASVIENVNHVNHKQKKDSCNKKKKMGKIHIREERDQTDY